MHDSSLQPRILLVEDDPSNRRLLTRQFERLGCAVDAMERAEQALEALRCVRYDVLVTDLFLSGQSGEWLLQQVCEQLSGRRPMAVVLTGETRTETHARLQLQGADQVLVKPVGLEDLSRLVERWREQASDCAATGTSEDFPQMLQEMAAVVDFRVLAHALGELDVVEVQRFLDLFLEGMDAALPELRRGLMAQDADAVIRICHRQSGAARAIGANICQGPLHDINSCATQERWQDAHKALQQLGTGLDRLREVRQRLQRQAQFQQS